MRNLKRALSLAMASVMLLGLMVVGTGASYTDVTSKNNQEAIEVLQAVGIMTGDDKGNFNPDQNVTRNEMAVVMANLMDYRVSTYKGTAPFKDVPTWAEPYVAACYTNGIVAGTSKTTYGGSQTVTTAQAALMLMKALGYFQYQSDFADDWQLATVKQANKIDLFDDVDSNVTSAMTRNDVAQLVLNTLQAGMVEASDDTIKVNTGDVSVEAGKVSYNYVTSTKSYATAISNLQPTSSTNATSGYIVELGEKLYNGDLKLNDTSGDNFNRPANVWTYNSSEVGKYANSADGTWTAKLTEKVLYDTVGSAAYDSYKWTVTRNGNVLAEDGIGGAHAGRVAAIAHGKTSTERVLTTGVGVLTQAYVDSDAKTVVLSLIDTGVAKVTKVVASGDKYDVTVSFKTKVSDGEAAITPDTKFTTDQKFAKDDIVIYTASASSKEIESMAVAQTVAGKVSAVKAADYVTVDGTQYSYNYAYTDTGKKFIGNGLYNIEDSEPAQNPAVDKNATIYLDAYGYAVAFEGKTDNAEDYLFVTDVGSVFTKDPSAKVVFFDGTDATINIDKLDGKDATTADIKTDTVYKFTKGTNSYDLEKVDPTKLKVTTGDTTSIKKDAPSIVIGNVAGKDITATTDNNTVFVDVENNKTWTGYKNVASKTLANVSIVMNKDNVAEIVFIYGSKLEGTAEDDDYIILKGTGYQSEKDKDNKTVYRLTDAYNVKGEKLDNAYVASESVAKAAVKGLYKIDNRNGDDYITTWTPLFAAKSNAGTAATYYATTAKNGVLTLNDFIKFGSNKPTTFAYNDKTTYVVIELKENGDVDIIRDGSISDIETYDTAAGADNTDVTGVYVMTVDNENDVAPLAETVLVIVPSDKGISGGKNVPVVNADDYKVTVSGLTVTDVLAYKTADQSEDALLAAVMAHLENTKGAITKTSQSGTTYTFTIGVKDYSWDNTAKTVNGVKISVDGKDMLVSQSGTDKLNTVAGVKGLYTIETKAGKTDPETIAKNDTIVFADGSSYDTGYVKVTATTPVTDGGSATDAAKFTTVAVKDGAVYAKKGDTVEVSITVAAETTVASTLTISGTGITDATQDVAAKTSASTLKVNVTVSVDTADFAIGVSVKDKA